MTSIYMSSVEMLNFILSSEDINMSKEIIMSMKKRSDHNERHKYACHKSKAKSRGIEFNLTYEQWWDIWQQSGKWDQRGKGKGSYVMSRIGDKGGYTLGNVFIQSNSDNVIEGNKNRIISAQTRSKLSEIRKKISNPAHIAKMHEIGRAHV